MDQEGRNTSKQMDYVNKVKAKNKTNGLWKPTSCFNKMH
jgi:hypothetical protein